MLRARTRWPTLKRALTGISRRAEARLDPLHRAVSLRTSLLHVAEVLVAGDGAFAEFTAVDGLKQRTFAAGFNAGFYEVAHKKLFL